MGIVVHTFINITDYIYLHKMLQILIFAFTGKKNVSEKIKVFDLCIPIFLYICLFFYYQTSTKSGRSYIFPAVCLCVCLSVCMSVCLSLCVCLNAYKKKSNRTLLSTWTRFSLNGCLPHWLEPFWNLWPVGSKVKLTVTLSYVQSKWNLVCRLDMPLLD